MNALIFFISHYPLNIFAGQAGLEPTTSGFGDRRSTVGATGLNNLFDLGFFMQCDFLVPLAILTELHLSLDVPAVFGSGVVFAITLTALEGNLFNRAFFCLCHFDYSLTKRSRCHQSAGREKPPIGLEPMTPALPWLCSTD